MNRKIEISERSILFAILFPLALTFLWYIHDILFSLLIAFILMSALRPPIQFFVDRKLPRVPVTFLVFLLFVLAFIGLAVVIIPPIVTETTIFAKSLPSIVRSLNPEVRQFVDFDNALSYLPNITTNVFDIVGNVFSNFFFVITTLFFTLYFLLEDNVLERIFSSFLPKERITRLKEVFEHVETRLTAWFWGQITLMTVIGVTTYIVLSVIGIRYALPLALLAGLLEIVPNLGPILAAIPAVTIGLAESYALGITIIIVYFIIQQLENTVIVPVIMKRAVGLSPITTLLALLIGGKVGGILGVLLAIPTLIIIQAVASELIKEFYHPRKKNETVQNHQNARND